MPEDSKDFKIHIETTASGDGAQKTEAALKKVNTEAGKTKESFTSAADSIKAAEEGAAKMAATTTEAAGTAAGGGVAGLAAAAAAGAAAIGVFAEGIRGLNTLAPTLSSSLGSIGGAIRGAFQEVMGGSIHRALSDLFGRDFEQRLQRIAESFGMMTARMKLMGEASADYIAKQRTLNDLLAEENRQLELAATHRKNLADEAQRESDLEAEIQKRQAEEDKAAIDRDPKREYDPAGKIREKQAIDQELQIAADEREDAALDARRKAIDDAERDAATRVNETDAAARAAAGISRGDYRGAAALDPAQRQKLTDAKNAVDQAVKPEDAAKARDALAKLIETFEKARRDALEKFEATAEEARHKRAVLDQDERRTEDARERRDREQARTAPVREAEVDLAEMKGDLDFRKKRDEAALKDIAERLKADANDAAAQAQLAALMGTSEPQKLQAIQQMITTQTQSLAAIAAQTAAMQSLTEKLAQQKALIEQLKSQIDSQ